jgi:hypothetical protein
MSETVIVESQADFPSPERQIQVDIAHFDSPVNVPGLAVTQAQEVDDTSIMPGLAMADFSIRSDYLKYGPLPHATYHPEAITSLIGSGNEKVNAVEVPHKGETRYVELPKPSSVTSLDEARQKKVSGASEIESSQPQPTSINLAQGVRHNIGGDSLATDIRPPETQSDPKLLAILSVQAELTRDIESKPEPPKSKQELREMYGDAMYDAVDEARKQLSAAKEAEANFSIVNKFKALDSHKEAVTRAKYAFAELKGLSGDEFTPEQYEKFYARVMRMADPEGKYSRTVETKKIPEVSLAAKIGSLVAKAASANKAKDEQVAKSAVDNARDLFIQISKENGWSKRRFNKEYSKFFIPNLHKALKGKITPEVAAEALTKRYNANESIGVLSRMKAAFKRNDKAGNQTDSETNQDLPIAERAPSRRNMQSKALGVAAVVLAAGGAAMGISAFHQPHTVRTGHPVISYEPAAAPASDPAPEQTTVKLARGDNPWKIAEKLLIQQGNPHPGHQQIADKDNYILTINGHMTPDQARHIQPGTELKVS